MIWWSDTVSVLAISQLAVFGLFFLSRNSGTQSGLLALFSLGMISYLISQLSVVESRSLTSYLLNRFSTITPLVLWVFAFNLFEDGGRVKPGIWILMGFFVLARAIGTPLYDASAPGADFWFVIIYFLPQVILLGFSIHTICLAIIGYRHDLLSQRRKVRVVFVCCMGIILTVIVGNGFFSFVDPFLSQISLFSINPLPGIIFPAYLFIATLGVNLIIFRLQDSAMDLLANNQQHDSATRGQASMPRKDHSAALELVTSTIEAEQLYTDPELTISRLATTLSMQEYKLRRLINQELGYRNFNQFLNHYRIEAASRRLAESEKAISTIAMEVGYSSLSSFNKAFREINGTTPSAFRHEKTGTTLVSPE